MLKGVPFSFWQKPRDLRQGRSCAPPNIEAALGEMAKALHPRRRVQLEKPQRHQKPPKNRPQNCLMFQLMKQLAIFIEAKPVLALR
jgi:hypothetical protein